MPLAWEDRARRRSCPHQTEGTYLAQNTSRRLKITVSADEKGLRHRDDPAQARRRRHLLEHRGPCRDPQRHRGCPGLWRGEFTTGYTGDGKRTRRKVSGTTEAAVIDKLRDLHHQLDTGHHPQARLRPLHRPAGRRRTGSPTGWTAAPKTVTKNQNVLEPILKVIGAASSAT